MTCSLMLARTLGSRILSALLLGALLGAPALQAAHILLVRNSGGDSTTQSLHDFLVAAGHTVTREERTSGPGNLDGIDLILVARETNSSSYRGSGEEYNEAPVPMILMAPHIMRSSRWGWVNGEGLPGLDNVTGFDSPFIDPNHPIVLGQTGSLLEPGADATGLSSSLPAGATALATLGGGVSHGIFIIPSGTAMFNNNGTAGDVRIGFLRGNEGAWDLATPNGEQLLANTINWALGLSASPATVGNRPATGIGPSTATVGGEVTDTGGSIPGITIYYGDHDGGTNPGAWDHSIGVGSQSGVFSTGLSGLAPGTTYFFRCFAANAGGDSWAPGTAGFATAAPPDPPAVVNQPATSIDFTRAELNGAVTSGGGETPEVTIFWGTADAGTDAGAWEQSLAMGSEGGAFTREVVGLEDGTTYYFRSFAQNSGGASWAESTESFTTPAYTPPVVVNTPASGITGISARVGGTVTATGGDPPAITIYHGGNDGGTDPGAWDGFIDLDPQSAAFGGALTGLAPLTTYYFRCFARNGGGSAWAPGTASFTTPDVSALLINEILTANNGGYTNYPNPGQVAGRTDDWIEILNTGAATLSLAGWHLTDDPLRPNQWTFPAGTSLAPGAFLLVYASADGQPDANGNLHTNFRLSAGGEQIALVRPDLTTASEFGPGGTEYPEQRADVSYGLHPASALPVFFSTPTPGAANDAGGQDRVRDTRFSVDRGIHSAPFEVAITTGTPNAVVYFTTDGEDPIAADGTPTPTATAYGGPVSITRTTVLRAAAVREGLAPTNIDTHTYILLDVAGAGPDGLDPGGLNAAILEQTRPAGYPSLFSDNGRSEDDGDYDMDQGISKARDPAANLPAGTSRAQALVQGLVDIPTLSIAMNIDDFAGPENGIYTHASSSGFAWERACSAELIHGDHSGSWQEDCGLRVQGGASRTRSPKHGMSLRFREAYGAGKLRQKLFPDSSVGEFDVLALRAGYNNSWIHWDAGQRDRGSMIRDQFARDTMLAMGHPAAGHGFMVHLYINGLYWGVHNLAERQDAAHYAAYNGGDEEQLDARNAGTFIDGDASSYEAMTAVVGTGDWSAIRQVLDVDMHIDYQIMNRYGGNSDLSAGNNWRAAGGGPFPDGQPGLMAPWQVYSWDAERILEDPSHSSQPADPMGLRTILAGHPEYRMRFADRLQRHFFHDGPLTPARAEARWMARAAELDRPIIAEAARWGDHRQDVGFANEVYDRNDDWLTEQDRLRNSYFPVRSANVLGHYRDDGLFPLTGAPVFHVNASPQHGGEIPDGGTLSLVGTAGTIHYTLDGSDPRLEGGTANPAALTASSGTAIPFSASGLVRARVLNGGEWSALSEGGFFVEALAGFGDLVVSEIHHHPTPPTVLEQIAGANFDPPQQFTDSDFEFVEILSTSLRDLNLSGAGLAGGITGVFDNFVLAAGARAVAVSNPEAFLVRHPGLAPLIAGTFTGRLDNDGDRILLHARDAVLLADFRYDDTGTWPARADGAGSSLELAASGADPGHPESWRPSVEYNGSPGVPGAGTDGRVVINEVLTHSEPPALDAIELLNTTGSPIDLTGWLLSDSASPALHLRSFALPTTILPAGGRVVFDESDFNLLPDRAVAAYAGTPAAAPTTVSTPGHGLADGDVITIAGYGGVGRYNATFEVAVAGPDTITIDTPFLDDDVLKGAWTAGRPFALSSARGESLVLMETDAAGRPARFVDVAGFAAARPGETLGRWPDGAGTGTLVTMTTNSLGGPNAPAKVGPVIISEVMYHPASGPEDHLEFVELCNTGGAPEPLAQWRLRGGVDFEFDGSHHLAPRGILVVVGFDPLTDLPAVDAFRAAYAIDAAVPLAGPWTDGPLRNDRGTVRLQRPDSPPPDDPAFFPQVTEDEVIYSSQPPWPGPAGGLGDSLQRTGIDHFGNFASSWAAAAPTPGAKRLDYAFYRDLTFGPGQPPGSGPDDDHDRDGVPNIVEYALGLDPQLPDAVHLPSVVLAGGEATLTYLQNSLLHDITYQVQASDDLLVWMDVASVLVGTPGHLGTYRATVPIADGPHRFLRIAIRW